MSKCWKYEIFIDLENTGPTWANEPQQDWHGCQFLTLCDVDSIKSTRPQCFITVIRLVEVLQTEKTNTSIKAQIRHRPPSSRPITASLLHAKLIIPWSIGGGRRLWLVHHKPHPPPEHKVSLLSAGLASSWDRAGCKYESNFLFCLFFYWVLKYDLVVLFKTELEKNKAETLRVLFLPWHF